MKTLRKNATRRRQFVVLGVELPMWLEFRVYLNSTLIVATKSVNEGREIARNLSEALGVRADEVVVKGRKWWGPEEVDACVKGLLVLSPEERAKLALLRG